MANLSDEILLDSNPNRVRVGAKLFGFGAPDSG
jgi:hypothetical protein